MKIPETSTKYIPRLTCYCQGQFLLGKQYESCRTDNGGKCFSSQEISFDEYGNEYSVRSYGCLTANETIQPFKDPSTRRSSKYNVQYCTDLDFCNKPPIQNSVNLSQIIISVLISSIILSLAIVVILVVILHLRFKRRARRSEINVEHECAAEGAYYESSEEESKSKSAAKPEICSLLKPKEMKDIKLTFLIVPDKYCKVLRKNHKYRSAYGQKESTRNTLPPILKSAKNAYLSCDVSIV